MKYSHKLISIHEKLSDISQLLEIAYEFSLNENSQAAVLIGVISEKLDLVNNRTAKLASKSYTHENKANTGVTMNQTELIAIDFELSEISLLLEMIDKVNSDVLKSEISSHATEKIDALRAKLSQYALNVKN